MLESREGRRLSRVRTAGRIALLLGAVGTLGFLVHAGQRTPRFLLVLMGIWVVSPFVALGWADKRSPRWSAPTRWALYGVMLVVALGSLAVYTADALGPPRAKPAFMYVLVPPLSWILSAIAVLIGRALTPASDAAPGER